VLNSRVSAELHICALLRS